MAGKGNYSIPDSSRGYAGGKTSNSNITPLNPSADLWETEDGTYSLDSIYTKSKDQQGHSSTFHVKVPDYLAGKIASVVESKEIPEYRTANDVIRDAIIHRLHYLSERRVSPYIKEEIDRSLNRAYIENESLSYLEELKGLGELVEHVENVCREAFSQKDLVRFRDHLESQIERASNVREPFRTRIMEVIEKYARLLNQELIPLNEKPVPLGYQPSAPVAPEVQQPLPGQSDEQGRDTKRGRK